MELLSQESLGCKTVPCSGHPKPGPQTLRTSQSLIKDRTSRLSSYLQVRGSGFEHLSWGVLFSQSPASSSRARGWKDDPFAKGQALGARRDSGEGIGRVWEGCQKVRDLDGGPQGYAVGRRWTGLGQGFIDKELSEGPN